MSFEDVKIVRKPLFRSTSKQVDQAEAKLEVTFPSGYRDFITKFGEGVLGGTYIRIYPPRRILAELEEWRQRIKEYWFWDEGPKLLSQKKALECIVVGDTLDGDELVFHPTKPETIYVLPRNFERVFVAGKSGLEEAIEWLCTAGKLTEPFAERNFEPFDSRNE